MTDAQVSCPRCNTPNVRSSSPVIFCESCGELIDLQSSQSGSDAEESADSSEESSADQTIMTTAAEVAAAVKAATPQETPVLIATPRDGSEFPEAWSEVETNVPAAEEPLAVDVFDLVGDLGFDEGEENDFETLDPAQDDFETLDPAQDDLPNAPSLKPSEDPATKDQDVTVMLSATPYQMAQAISARRTKTGQQNTIHPASTEVNKLERPPTEPAAPMQAPSKLPDPPPPPPENPELAELPPLPAVPDDSPSVAASTDEASQIESSSLAEAVVAKLRPESVTEGGNVFDAGASLEIIAADPVESPQGLSISEVETSPALSPKIPELKTESAVPGADLIPPVLNVRPETAQTDGAISPPPSDSLFDDDEPYEPSIDEALQSPPNNDMFPSVPAAPATPPIEAKVEQAEPQHVHEQLPQASVSHPAPAESQGPVMSPPEKNADPFASLAAIAEEVKATEQARSNAEILPVPEETRAPVEQIESAPQPSPPVQRPQTTSPDKMSHGFQVDFGAASKDSETNIAPEEKQSSASFPMLENRPMTMPAPVEASSPAAEDTNLAPPVPAPAVMPASAPPTPTEEPSQAEQLEDAVKALVDDTAASSSGEEIKIARPSIVVPLHDPNIEEPVRLLAVSMTASVKKARVDGRKSLILSGLLLTQAQMLRHRLRSQNVFSKLVDPDQIAVGYTMKDLEVVKRRGKPVLVYGGIALGLVLIVATIIGGAQTLLSNYETNSALREAAQSTVAELPAAPAVVKPVAPRKARIDIVPMKDVGFAGRSSSWWVKRIRQLRIKERSAPSDTRALVRRLLIDTERKARSFGIVVQN